jgi:hypothetical protein
MPNSQSPPSVFEADWSSRFVDLNWIARKDGKWYADASAILFIAFVISTPFFWPLGLFLGALALASLAYFYFNAFRLMEAISGRVVNKTAWKTEKNLEVYRFTVQVEHKYRVQKKGLQEIEPTRLIQEIKVSKLIYNSFELSDRVFFVFSGFGELLAYEFKGGLNLLAKTITNKEGNKTRFSISIPQKHLKSGSNWQRID